MGGIMKRSLIAVLLVSAGCATGAWYRPNGTEAGFRQDNLECDYEARKATAATISGFQAGWEQATLRRMCMQTRGYEWRVKPAE